MHTVLLVNKDLRGQQIQPVSGKSGKLYGNATYNPVYSCPVFSMSLEDYEKAADDVMGNAFAGQQWIAVFRPEPDNKPAVEQPMPSKFRHLETQFELTDYGLRVSIDENGVSSFRISIDALRAFASQIDPRVWFRLISRDSDGVVTIESKRAEDFDIPPSEIVNLIAEAGLGAVTGTLSEQVQHLCAYIKDAQVRGAPRMGDDFGETPQPAEVNYRPLLTLFTANELRALAKKLKADTKGSREDLMTAISEKVSTE